VRARVLQDRLVRLGGGDRIKEIPIAEWERLYQVEVEARRLLHQGKGDWGGMEKWVVLRTRRILTNPGFANVIAYDLLGLRQKKERTEPLCFAVRSSGTIRLPRTQKIGGQ
jgi:hypothetical protein